MNLFVEAALEQRANDLLAQAGAMAAATSSAFNGTDKPLKALQKSLKGKVTASGVVGELQNRMMQLRNRGAVAFERKPGPVVKGGKLVHGPDGR